MLSDVIDVKIGSYSVDNCLENLKYEAENQLNRYISWLYLLKIRLNEFFRNFFRILEGFIRK